MAYSSVRVQFELGHEASVRTKKTPEGFTHDWEVFVRGADNTEIQCFVEKVVFHLHETFPKPRRVIKDPPYVVKESGYAGFVLPIDVYLKNKEEPKKISFQYDLTLQPSGPPISRVLREPRLFQNPSEDFRRKLIRGGGVGVDTPSEVQLDDLKIGSAGTNKLKTTESPVKKHKPDLVQNDSFAELFGTPIRRVEAKKLPELPKKLPEVDLSKDKKLNKHGSYKNEKDIIKEKTKYSEKERNKERDKIKEKPPKRLSSPPLPLRQVVKSKDEHKKHEEKKKEDYDDKKKRKEEKDKKEKPKDVKEIEKPNEKEHKKEKREPKDGDFAKKLNSIKSHDVKPSMDKRSNENEEKERPEKEKHKHRHKKKEREKNREKEKHKKAKDKTDKESGDREREKEKGSKKKHEEVREKEEKVKRKSLSPSPAQERLKKGPLNDLLDELGSSGSASPLSGDNDDDDDDDDHHHNRQHQHQHHHHHHIHHQHHPIPSFKALTKPAAKVVPEVKIQPVVKVNSKLKSTNLNVPAESRSEKEGEKPTQKVEEISPVRNKKEKSSSKKSKKTDKDVEKRKTKEEPRVVSTDGEEEESEKIKEDREPSEKDVLEEEKPKSKKEKENRKGKREKSEEDHAKAKKVNTVENNVISTAAAAAAAAAAVEIGDGSEDVPRAEKFTKEYIAQLKDLQHRIMTLEDGDDLQNIVKMIAETGQYEITKKTFDFDLCALDLETVKRLQNFFAST